MLRSSLFTYLCKHLSMLTNARKTWELTVMYASPNPSIRGSLWRDLKSLQIRLPWCLIWDFNVVLFGYEQSFSGEASPSFLDIVKLRGLVDMGFAGPRFTWNHNKFIPLGRSARLDRELCNEDWGHMLPEGSIEHPPFMFWSLSGPASNWRGHESPSWEETNPFSGSVVHTQALLGFHQRKLGSKCAPNRGIEGVHWEGFIV